MLSYGTATAPVAQDKAPELLRPRRIADESRNIISLISSVCASRARRFLPAVSANSNLSGCSQPAPLEQRYRCYTHKFSRTRKQKERETTKYHVSCTWSTTTATTTAITEKRGNAVALSQTQSTQKHQVLFILYTCVFLLAADTPKPSL